MTAASMWRGVRVSIMTNKVMINEHYRFEIVLMGPLITPVGRKN